MGANQALRQALSTKVAEDAFAVHGMEPLTSTPEELAERLRLDYDRWGKVVKAANFKFG